MDSVLRVDVFGYRRWGGISACFELYIPGVNRIGSMSDASSQYYHRMQEELHPSSTYRLQCRHIFFSSLFF